MIRWGIASGCVVVLAAALRLLAARYHGAAWGFNHLAYLNQGQAAVWTALALAAFIPALMPGAFSSYWREREKAFSVWTVLIVSFLIFRFLPSATIPLLGDGLERIEATLAGLKALEGQPAPLDIIIHIAFNRTGLISRQNEWVSALHEWLLISQVSGALAMAFYWKLARLRTNDRGGRAFVFFSIVLSGTFLFFTGYAENYVTLAAGIAGILVLIELVDRKKAPTWTLLPASILLVGLHYFMALTIPALLYALYKRGIWKPAGWMIAVFSAAAFVFAVLIAGMLDQYYGGVKRIFVDPTSMFSGYHVVGFLNQQVLAFPAFLLMVPLAVIAARRRGMNDSNSEGHADNPPSGDLLMSFLGLSSIVLLVFFFALRPVIGPTLDWDLFAIPSFFYIPWLVLYVHGGLGEKDWFPAVAWPVVVLALISTGPWLSVNTSDKSFYKRYKDLMEWEARHNDWAASYGYLRYGRYVSRLGVFTDEQEIVWGLEKAAETNPDSATLMLQVGDAYKAADMEERSFEYYCRHHVLKAEYHVKKGAPDKALEEYGKALVFAEKMEDRGLISEVREKIEKLRQGADK